MADDKIFVERRDQDDYSGRRPNSEMASNVLPTSAKAIERAGEIASDATILSSVFASRTATGNTSGLSHSRSFKVSR